MKRNFAICLALLLSSWWQQPLGRTYGLQCQNGVMVNDSFASSKTKRFRQHQFTRDKLLLNTNLKHVQI